MSCLCLVLAASGCTLDFDEFEAEENFGARDTGSATDADSPVDTGDGCADGDACRMDGMSGDSGPSDTRTADGTSDTRTTTDADAESTDTEPAGDAGDTGEPSDSSMPDTMDAGPDCSDPEVGTLPDGSCACSKEGERRPCYAGPMGTAGQGVCRPGTRTCTNGTWSLCQGEVLPSKEACDGKDNDCNGQVDELSKCRNSAGEPCRADGDCRSGNCASGKCAHRIFVTSGTYTGKLGGLSGADTKCTNAASAAGMGGSWKAILSHKDKEALTRIAVKAPIHMLNGRRIAASKSALWDGNLEAPINVDETMGSQSGPVWTATAANGKWVSSQFVTLKTCSKWTTASAGKNGSIGDSSQKNYAWIINFMKKRSCNQQARLYCIDGQ